MPGRSLSVLVVLSVVLTSFLVGACSGGASSPAVDYRGDALCQNAVVTDGTSCDLSVSMHGHTYLMSCDLSQPTCTCRRDGRPVDGASAFGGSATPTCTLTYLDLEWSDCCGTPD
jgi:hypothetical protein